MTWVEWKAKLDADPSMVLRRMQCEIDGHVLGERGLVEWSEVGRRCLVCGDEIPEPGDR